MPRRFKYTFPNKKLIYGQTLISWHDLIKVIVSWSVSAYRYKSLYFEYYDHYILIRFKIHYTKEIVKAILYVHSIIPTF